jgi:hypothetical protein
LGIQLTPENNVVTGHTVKIKNSLAWNKDLVLFYEYATIILKHEGKLSNCSSLKNKFVMDNNSIDTEKNI